MTTRATATGTVERFRQGDIFSRSTDVPLNRLAESAQPKTRPKLLKLAQSNTLPLGGEKILRRLIREKTASAQSVIREQLLNPTFLTPENAADLIGFSREQNAVHRAMQKAGSEVTPRFSLVESGALANALKDSQIEKLNDVPGTISSATDFFKSLGSKKGLREFLTGAQEKLTDDLIRARQAMLHLAGGKNIVAGKAAAHVLLKNLSGLLGNARAIMQRGIHNPANGKGVSTSKKLYAGNMVQDLLKPVTDHLTATKGKFTQADIEEALHIADQVAVSKRAIGEYEDMRSASDEYQKFIGEDMLIDSPLRLRGVISEADETRFLNMDAGAVQTELAEKIDAWADTITGRTQGSHRAIIEDAKNQGVLEMADAVGDVTRNINRAKLEYVFQKGFIKEEHYQAALKKQDYFTPFQRVLGEEQTRASATGGDLWHVFKGSEKDILNPVQSTIDSTINWLRRADINEVFQRMIQTTDADALLELGIKRVSENTPNAIPIWLDGEKSFYAFSDKKLLDSFLRIGKAEPEDTFTKILASVSRIIKGSVTHHPGFAMRNFVKDSVARAILSDTGSGVLDAVPGLTQFSDSEIERFIFAGGDQAGFYDRASENYAKKLHVAIRSAATDKSTIFLDPKRLGDLASGTWEKWGDIVGKSETLNRLAEFRSALKKIRATHPNISDSEAERLAAYKARDLLDFAVAGEFGRKLNRFIPFLNPAIQGTSKMLRTARENPTRFVRQLTLYVAAPSIGTLAYNESVGAGAEYRQLPAYRRDMFWNFKVGNSWLVIPKPFELGALGTGFERAVDYSTGNKQAFEGFFPTGIKPRELGSLLKAVSPVDEGVLFGPMKPFIEVITNRDIFRDRYIVPPHEQPIHPLGRKGDTRASRLGKWLSEFAITRAMLDDPRAWDHLTSGIFADFGRGAQTLSDFGREDKPSGVIKQLTAGLARSPNAYGSLDVQAALTKSSELKQNRTKEVRGFLERLRKTTSAKTGKERDRRVQRTIKEAARLRRMLERKRPETIFGK